MGLVGRQLAGTWLVGSVTIGTLAVLFTRDRGFLPVRPLPLLPLLSLFGVLGALAVLVAGLGLVAWRTANATWLPTTVRGQALWVAVVAVGGLVGGGYAAAATFAAEYPLGVQLALGYVAGGLPFALVAAMLMKPPRLNVAAIAATVVLLLIGAAVMDGRPLSTCVSLLSDLVLGVRAL